MSATALLRGVALQQQSALTGHTEQSTPLCVNEEGLVAQLEVARRYTVKLSEIIQEQSRDLEAQAAA